MRKIAFRLQQESVVVAFHLALIVITQEILGDGFRLTEIKAITAYRFQPLIRDPHLIDRQIRVRQDLEFVAADIGLIAVKVEIGVVSQVDRARLVDDRAVLNGDTIIFGQGKARGCGEIAREALVSVEGVQREPDLTVILLHNLPATFIKPFGAAVQLIFTLAGKQGIGYAVQRKPASGDAVGVAAYGCAQKSGLLDILLGRCAAEQGFAHAAVRHWYAGRK